MVLWFMRLFEHCNKSISYVKGISNFIIICRPPSLSELTRNIKKIGVNSLRIVDLHVIHLIPLSPIMSELRFLLVK